VLTNEYNGSDGEAFLEHFKARKLGTVIGVPSWGGWWASSTASAPSTTHRAAVEQRFYGRQGTGGSRITAPIRTSCSRMTGVGHRGRDLQLERAIALLLEQIKTKPFVFPAKPAIKGR